MAEIICGIYRIINTITGDFYIGSSKDIKRRWSSHKSPSIWERYPNNPMYHDMRKYGKDKFAFEILAEVKPESLKETEQQFIEKLQPTYNSNRANGWDIERKKEYNKEYKKSDKWKEYNKSDKCKKQRKEYDNQLCFYNGEAMTLCALRKRFKRRGITHPTIEAKKYLML